MKAFFASAANIRTARRSEFAVRWRLKDGKIIEHQAFWDTASLLIQQGALKRPPPQP